ALPSLAPPGAEHGARRPEVDPADPARGAEGRAGAGPVTAHVGAAPPAAGGPAERVAGDHAGPGDGDPLGHLAGHPLVVGDGQRDVVAARGGVLVLDGPPGAGLAVAEGPGVVLGAAALVRRTRGVGARREIIGGPAE